MKHSLVLLLDDIAHWQRGWLLYIEKRLRRFGIGFESNKSIIVDVLMAKRGTYQRPFLHFSLGLLFVAGVMSAPMIASAQNGNISSFTPPSAVASSIDFTDYGVQTKVSEKPRDQVISYTIVKGDTLSTIAQKFGISVDTIKWATNITSDTIKPGDIVDAAGLIQVLHPFQVHEFRHLRDRSEVDVPG